MGKKKSTSNKGKKSVYNINIFKEMLRGSPHVDGS